MKVADVKAANNVASGNKIARQVNVVGLDASN